MSELQPSFRRKPTGDASLPEQIEPHAAPEQWIPCAKRIPELHWGRSGVAANAESDPVLIYCTKRGKVLFGRLVVVDKRLVWLVFSAGGYMSGLSENVDEVTHWRPFPKPPSTALDGTFRMSGGSNDGVEHAANGN